MSDDTRPGVSRDGEPKLIQGQLPGSAKLQNEYEIRTTPVPVGATGYDWAQFFNSQFTGQKAISGHHDGRNKITVYCWPDDQPNLIEKVDSALGYANDRLGTLPRKGPQKRSRGPF
jgi:hypothetical protein